MHIAELIEQNAEALRGILDDADGHVFVCGRAGFCVSVQDAIDRHCDAGEPMKARVLYECFGPPAAGGTGGAADSSTAAVPVIDRTEVRRHNHREMGVDRD